MIVELLCEMGLIGELLTARGCVSILSWRSLEFRLLELDWLSGWESGIFLSGEESGTRHEFVFRTRLNRPVGSLS